MHVNLTLSLRSIIISLIHVVEDEKFYLPKNAVCNVVTIVCNYCRNSDDSMGEGKDKIIAEGA